MGTSKNNHQSKSAIDCAGIEFLGDRDGQEDYFLAQVISNGSEVLATLADGMGGHASGEVASQRAVEAFNKTVKEYPSDSITAKLAAGLQQANNEIANSINGDASLDGMGCTLVGLHIGSDGLRWISVGDSPLFLFRNGSLRQLNADHSMAPVIEESLRQGKISKEEALNHPHRNALRSAVMGADLTLIDTPETPFGLMAGDILVLASDGILTLSKTEMQSILKKSSQNISNEICSSLIDAVKNKKRPRQDNTTAVVIKVSENMGSHGGPSKILRVAAVLSILSFLVALGWTLYPKLNLKSIIYDGVKKPIAVVESPTPVPAPNREESKVLETVAVEAKTAPTKTVTPPIVEKPKASSADNSGKSSKGSNRSKVDSGKEKSADKSTDKTIDHSADKETEKQVDKAVEKSGDVAGKSNNSSGPSSQGQLSPSVTIIDKSSPAPISGSK